MKNKKTRSILVLALAALLLTVAVSGTLAYLVDATQSVTNTFAPTYVSVEVEDETAENFTKKNVKITNTSNIKAYIRAAIVANWQNDGNIVIAGWNDHGSITLGTGWVRNGDGITKGDGYYYYTQPVEAKTVVPNNLFDTYTYDGDIPTDVYGTQADHLQMDILVQAIQAEPIDAVKAAWGVEPTTLQ